MGVLDGIRVLDAGCGRGRILSRLAALYPHSRFLGLDLSAGAITYAREEASRAGLNNVEFVDADTRAWGGPHYAELEAYVATLPGGFDLATAFAGADAETRRPVDLVGLLEIVHREGLVETDDVSIVEAVRPDGTTRRFAFGAVTAGNTNERDADD